jgi:hypothetical chaperone protein
MFCGIDFGTSNSAIGLSQKNKISLVAVEGKHQTLPTAIFYPDNKATPTFGRQAMASFTQGYGGRLMRSLKRALGTGLMVETTMVSGQRLGFETIIQTFVQNLKDKADQQNGIAISSVVMGRPVCFNDNNPEGDKQAELTLQKIAKAVGFAHVEFQFEPIAAAFAHEAKLPHEHLALVVDIGGGTSDFTIMKLAKKYASKANRRDDILANTGVRVGGTDFDKQLSLKNFMPLLGMQGFWGAKHLPMPTSYYFDLSTWNQINSLYTHKVMHDAKKLWQEAHEPHVFARLLHVLTEQSGHILLDSVEQTKIALTDNAKHIQALNFIEAGLHCTSTRLEFEAAIEAELTKIDQAVEGCLQAAGVKATDIDLVILTGGSTEVPIVKAYTLAKFPQAKLSEENKLSSVALGLAHDAARRFG